MTSHLPTPEELGAPPPFTTWRESQAEAFQAAIESDKRFIVIAAPTGVGKGLIGVCLHSWLGGRGLYLTGTKGLQDQLRRDFGSMGLTDVRGMANYGCRELDMREDCSQGPCLDGHRCIYLNSGCHYFEAVRDAKTAGLASTNYAFHFTKKAGNELGHRDLLICDEAHAIPEELAGYLRVDLHDSEIAYPHVDQDMEAWAGWALERAGLLERRLESMPAGYGKRRLRDLLARLRRLGGATQDWVVERTDRGVGFEPLWPAPYCEEWLWRGAKKVVLMSATIRPQTLEYMGLKDGDYEFIEFPSPFPRENRPIIQIADCPRINFRATDEDMELWLLRADQIIGAREDRKGIFHTVSYARAKYVLENSQWAERMVFHTSRDTRAVVEKFKESREPLVLVSPSVGTGWDFPGDAASFQIIGKIPYPDTRSPVMKMRTELDDRYSSAVAAQEMVQMAGRIIRGPEDRGETFIIDGNFAGRQGWFFRRNLDSFPRWWRQAFRVEETIPRPLDL